MRHSSMTILRRATGVAVMLVVLLATGGCRFLGVGSGPGSSSPPSPIDAGEAAQLVLQQDQRFAGITERDPNLIGQAAWYEVKEAEAGWQVTVRIGWGDCPAGCIDEHIWRYSVTPDGKVTLDGESGPPLPSDGSVSGTVTKGPICPVERDPPDPACADRPVDGAVMLIEDAAGAEVARVTSTKDGTFSLELAPGAYRLVPQPVEGLLGTAGPMEFRVEAGEPPVVLQVSYDTGIR